MSVRAGGEDLCPSEARRASLRHGVALAIAVLLAVVAVAGGVAFKHPHNTNVTRGIPELVEATGERRLVAGRLAGGFAWAPTATVRGSTSSAEAARWEIAAVAARLREKPGSAADTHAIGVAHLLLGNVDEAIPKLEAAAEDAPGDANVLSDLAAALLERGRRPDRAPDVVRALDMAGQALAIGPEKPEPRFNKAVAVETLGLREAALTAWEDYLRVDGDSPWAQEAKERSSRLRQTTARSWRDDAASFEQACALGDLPRAESLVRLHPQQATEFVLWHLLPRWAEQTAAGNSKTARSAMQSLRCAGDAVAKVIGDRLPASVADEAQIADSGGSARSAFLAGCNSLAEGHRLLDEMDAERAGKHLAEAVRQFSAIGSVLRHLAELNKLSSDHYEGTFQEAAAVSLAERAEEGGARMIAAKARWLLGLSLTTRGYLPEALPVLARARDGLEQLGFSADAAFVGSLEAGTWRALGRNSMAWAESMRLFSRLDEISDPRRAQVIVEESAIQTEIEGHAQAALILQEAALMFAEQHESVVDLCDAQVWLARLAARAGQSARALRALDSAERALPRIAAGSLREHLFAEISLIRAGLFLARDPSAAAEHASRAIRYFGRSGAVSPLVEGHVLRARASEAQQRVEQAERDYVAAIEAVELQRSSMDDPELQVSFLDARFELARELVRFEWSQGRSERALLWADRLRARTLREAAEMPEPDGDPLAEIRRRLRPSDAVLFYSCLADRTIVWVLRDRGVHAVALERGERWLQHRVRTWRSTMSEGDMAGSAREAAALFAALVTPVREHLLGASTVIVVPDGVLHLVSWASLRDPDTGRFWIEQAAVAVAPCLGAARVTPWVTDGSAVIVGNPSFDRSLFPELPELAEAAREAAEVASLYPGAELLAGAEATPERVLRAAERAHVLHVAAHALADGVDAERSVLVLAPGEGVAAQGLVMPKDIRSRRFQHLKLVVLAACRSGDGPLSRSEGTLSLSRPFLQAGAGAVLVSLLDLPDQPSPASHIHRYLQGGLEPIEAFRRAVLQCWTDSSPDPRSCGGLQLIVNGGEV